MKNILTVTLMKQYESHLLQEEKSVSTQKQYRREILRFLAFVSEKKITKELVIQYKKELMDQYQPVSVNTKLAAVNGFLSFAGYGEYRVKQLKIQRKPYCSSDRELTKAEYTRLLQSAKNQGQDKLWTILQTICGMGIRISELPFITAQAVRDGEAAVQLKGKNRVILMGEKTASNFKKIYGQTGDFPRPALCDKKWKANGPQQYLENDEKTMPQRQGESTKGLSAQSSPPVCQNIL